MLESYLGEILVRRGVVTEERLKPFFAQQREREKGPNLLDLLLPGNVADGAAVGQALADESRLPFVQRIDIEPIATAVAAKHPIPYAKALRILLTAADDSRWAVVAALRHATARP